MIPKVLLITKTVGYVGNLGVEEFKYSGKDSGLSHYSILGDKSYMGTVNFSQVISVENIRY